MVQTSEVKPECISEPIEDKENFVFRSGQLEVLTGQANPSLSQSVGELLNLTIEEPISEFEDGEKRAIIKPSLRKKEVFIIQPTSPPDTNGNIMELLVMIDASRRASAVEINAVIPFFGYARQDRKEQPGVPISAALMANLITTAGADRIVTVDIHSTQQQGFTHKPWDNLHGSYSLVPAIKELGLPNLVVACPDIGGGKRTKDYAQFLETSDVAMVYKQRDVALGGESNTLFFVGDVNGRNVLMVDDIISSAKTITDAAVLLKSNGAEQIYLAATHGLFLGNSLELLTNGPIDGVFVTDSVMHRKEVLNHPKIKVVTIAPLLAAAIRQIHTGESLSKDLFI